MQKSSDPTRIPRNISRARSHGARRRGFGLLSISLGAAVGLSLMAGGTMVYQKTERDRSYHDISLSSQFIRSMIAVEAGKHASIPEGYFPAIYDIALPGFIKDDAGMFHHRWASDVELRHLGSYVVVMHLDDVSSSRCSVIAAHADEYADGAYKGYLTIGDRFWSDPRSSGSRDAMTAACNAADEVMVGWTFAHSPAAVLAETGLSLADPVASEGDDDPVDVPVIPGGGSDPDEDTPDPVGPPVVGGGQADGDEPVEEDPAAPDEEDAGADEDPVDPDPEDCGNAGNGNSGSGTPGNSNPGSGNCGNGNPGGGNSGGGTGSGNQGNGNGNGNGNPGNGNGNPGNGDGDTGNGGENTGGENSGGTGGTGGDEDDGPVLSDFVIPDSYLPGGWGSSPGWGPTMTSVWMPVDGSIGLWAGESFEIWGPNSPTMQTESGQQKQSGTISRWGTNIVMAPPPCGGSVTVYIRVGGSAIGSWTISRPDWPAEWGARPAECDYF